MNVVENGTNGIGVKKMAQVEWGWVVQVEWGENEPSGMKRKMSQGEWEENMAQKECEENDTDGMRGKWHNWNEKKKWHKWNERKNGTTNFSCSFLILIKCHLNQVVTQCG